MLSRGVSEYPTGGETPLPGPPFHQSIDQPAGLSGMPPASRFTGRDDTLTLSGPTGAGDYGYMGRDISDPNTPAVPEPEGMFGRLHREAGGRGKR